MVTFFHCIYRRPVWSFDGLPTQMSIWPFSETSKIAESWGPQDTSQSTGCSATSCQWQCGPIDHSVHRDYTGHWSVHVFCSNYLFFPFLWMRKRCLLIDCLIGVLCHCELTWTMNPGRHDNHKIVSLTLFQSTLFQLISILTASRICAPHVCCCRPLACRCKQIAAKCAGLKIHGPVVANPSVICLSIAIFNYYAVWLDFATQAVSSV